MKILGKHALCYEVQCRWSYIDLRNEENNKDCTHAATKLLVCKEPFETDKLFTIQVCNRHAAAERKKFSRYLVDEKAIVKEPGE